MTGNRRPLAELHRASSAKQQTTATRELQARGKCSIQQLDSTYISTDYQVSFGDNLALQLDSSITLGVSTCSRQHWRRSGDAGTLVAALPQVGCQCVHQFPLEGETSADTYVVQQGKREGEEGGRIEGRKEEGRGGIQVLLTHTVSLSQLLTGEVIVPKSLHHTGTGVHQPLPHMFSQQHHVTWHHTLAE